MQLSVCAMFFLQFIPPCPYHMAIIDKEVLQGSLDLQSLAEYTVIVHKRGAQQEMMLLAQEKKLLQNIISPKSSYREGLHQTNPKVYKCLQNVYHWAVDQTSVFFSGNLNTA